MKHHQELIAALEKLHITITGEDVDEILQAGIDTFLLRRSENISQKEIDTIYLILNEMRTCESELDSYSTVKTSKIIQSE